MPNHLDTYTMLMPSGRYSKLDDVYFSGNVITTNDVFANDNIWQMLLPTEFNHIYNTGVDVITSCVIYVDWCICQLYRRYGWCYCQIYDSGRYYH